MLRLTVDVAGRGLTGTAEGEDKVPEAGAGAAEVEVYVGEHSKIVIRINQSTSEKIALAEPGEIVL